jgi:hypothetical protein
MAVAIDELLVSFGSDTKGFERGAKLVQDKLKEVASEADKAGDALKSTGDKGVSGFSALGNNLKGLYGNLANIKAGFDLAKSGVETVVGTLWGFVKVTTEAGSEIHDLAIRTGVSVEQLSAFRLVAKQSRVELSEFGNGVSKFNRLISEAARGSDSAKESLKRFGIDPKDALQNQQAALAKVFETINSLPPGIQRATAAQLAFGKSGDKLVDMIQNVGGNLDEFMRQAQAAGLVMSTDAANAADEFGDKLDALSFSAEEAERKVGQEMLPALTHALDDLNDAFTHHEDVVKFVAVGIGQTLSQEIHDIETMVSWLKVAAAYASGGMFAGAAAYSSEFAPKPLTTKVIDYGNSVPVNRNGGRDFFSGREKKQGKSDAEREAERQANAIKEMGRDYTEAALRVQLFTQDSLHLEAALYKLSKGYDTLSDANKKLADAEINRLFNSKQAQAYLDKNTEVRKAADELLKAQAQSLGEVESPLKAVNDLLLKSDDIVADLARKFGKDLPEGVMAGIDPAIVRLMHMNAVLLQIQQAMALPMDNTPVNIPGIDSPINPNQTGPSVAGSDNAPSLDFRQMLRWRADALQKMRFDWRDVAEQMSQDGSQAFARFFLDLEHGWKGAMKGLLMSFVDTLREMAAQALASQVFGAILNFAVGAFAGGLGGSHGGGGFSAGGKAGFATGGSFFVGGSGSRDKTPISFWATKGERVDVLTPEQQKAQGSSGVTVVQQHTHNWNIAAANPQAFQARETRRQIQRRYELDLKLAALSA